MVKSKFNFDAWFMIYNIFKVQFVFHVEDVNNFVLFACTGRKQ
jgi:hypothetical protein